MNKTILKRVAIALVGLLLIFSVGLIAFSIPKLYQGKSVRQWVVLLDPHGDRQRQREDASSASIQIGAAALPDLELILAQRQGVLESVREYAARFRIVNPSPVPLREMQSRACEAAYQLAERGHVDISGLVPNLQYHFTNGTYADLSGGRALAGAGPRGIAVLTNLLINGSRPAVQDMAGSALGHVRKRPEVIAALVHYAQSNTNAINRANALHYLRGCNGPPELLVPLGLDFLRNTDEYAQDAAAGLLEGYKGNESVRAAMEEFHNKKSAARKTSAKQENR